MWGTRSPERICRAAKEMGYDRLALTDTDNLYGLWRFLQACEREGITPIVGSELTDPSTQDRAVCLVENDAGYRNLCRLITQRHSGSGFALASAVESRAEGLTLLTQNTEHLYRWHEAGVSVAWAAPRKPAGSALRARKLCRHLGVPMVATPGSFFLDPQEIETHRMLRAIDLNISLSRLTQKDVAPADAWLTTPSDYVARFSVWPDTIRGTEKIAERLNFTGPKTDLVLPPWADARKNGGKTARSADQCLRDAAYRGARIRYGDDLSETVVNRLEHELAIIEQMQFSSYFLVVQDIVTRSPRICGRGSGAASLVAYCLGITNVCPIRYNLYFERFLNPGRSDPPDIDIDFAWDERDDVIVSVLERYRDHSALVCNHILFQPRMAIREVAKVFGLTDGEIGQISKRLPLFWWAEDIDDDLLTRLKQFPELGQLDFPEPWPQIIGIAQNILGIPRHLSVHPGGTVITPRPLSDYVPIEPAPKGVPIIQWEKDATEDSGLVKIDLLGNRSLAVVRDAIESIREGGRDFDETHWEPEDDAATQANMAEGLTMGCFYVESPAMRLLQKKTGAGDFEHLVIHSSIIRPAANEFTREYVRRLHGGSWDPIHPLLADVLDETFGIMVYQEDVSKTAMAIAGFSHVDADNLRKIMSKKDRNRKIEDYKQQFISGAREKGVSDKQIAEIWNMMMSFSGYSFCKPHSASYARVSFQAAYLKTHHPAEFMAAVISNQGGFYSTFAYVSEARRMGVWIQPPDVNASNIRWSARPGRMRVGLASVKHLAAATQERIIDTRKTGPYRSITDFLERVRPDDREARSLIHAGAFDSLHPREGRTSLLWALANWQKSKSSKHRPDGLFHGTTETPRPVFPPQPEVVRLRHEFASLGFLCDRHPMVLFNRALMKQSITKARDLHRFIGRQTRFAGLLITGKVVHTRQGDPMEFLTFEDETGLVEATFFPKAYHRFCAILDRTRPYILTGKVEEDFGALTMTVDHVQTVPKTCSLASGPKEERQLHP